MVTVALLMITGVWVAARHNGNTSAINNAQELPPRQRLLQEPPNHHPLYAYSVIARGAHNRSELAHAIATDPVVQKHYADFDYRKTVVTELKAARTAYLSYRMGPRVYWTRRKVRLLEGEPLLTDGVHYARTRCGNRISDQPKTPVLRNDPPPEAFETPIEARVADVPQLGPPGLWEIPPADSMGQAPPNTALPPLVPVGPGTPGVTGPPGVPGAPGGWIIPTVPIVPIVPIVPGGGGPFPPPNNPPPPIAPVPEPATVALLAAGLTGLGLMRRKQ